MKTKKVLILIAIPQFNYNDQNSAVLSFLEKIKSAFIYLGYEVDFFDDKNDESKVLSKSDISKKSNSVKLFIKKWKWLYYSIVMFFYRQRQRKMLKSILLGPKYDLVVEFYTLGSVFGKKLKENWNCELSVIFDSPVDEQFFEMYQTKSLFWTKLKSAQKATFESADKIMVYSPACKKYLVDKYKMTGEINVLPCVLHKDQTLLKRQPTSFLIGFIGSFLKWHKIDLLIKVFGEFNKKYPKSKMILIGFGDQWNNAKKLIQELDLSDKIELPGFVSEEELKMWKSKITVGVMPGSNWYGCPLKLFEYAWAGIPFVAPNSATINSIFMDEVDCLYIKKNDEFNSLFKAIEQYYLDSTLRKTISDNALKMVNSKYNKSKYLNDLIYFLDN